MGAKDFPVIYEGFPESFEAFRASLEDSTKAFRQLSEEDFNEELEIVYRLVKEEFKRRAEEAVSSLSLKDLENLESLCGGLSEKLEMRKMALRARRRPSL